MLKAAIRRLNDIVMRFYEDSLKWFVAMMCCPGMDTLIEQLQHGETHDRPRLNGPNIAQDLFDAK